MKYFLLFLSLSWVELSFAGVRDAGEGGDLIRLKITDSITDVTEQMKGTPWGLSLESQYNFKLSSLVENASSTFTKVRLSPDFTEAQKLRGFKIVDGNATDKFKQVFLYRDFWELFQKVTETEYNLYVFEMFLEAGGHNIDPVLYRQYWSELSTCIPTYQQVLSKLNKQIKDANVFKDWKFNPLQIISIHMIAGAYTVSQTDISTYKYQLSKTQEVLTCAYEAELMGGPCIETAYKNFKDSSLDHVTLREYTEKFLEGMRVGMFCAFNYSTQSRATMALGEINKQLRRAFAP